MPEIGLRPLAERARLIAALLAIGAAGICIAVHPRPFLGLSLIGGRVAWLCGAWGLVLLGAGWIIGRIADTVFGELIEAIWSSAAPAVIALVGGGLLLGVGIWIGGRALEGLVAPPARRRAVTMQSGEAMWH